MSWMVILILNVFYVCIMSSYYRDCVSEVMHANFCSDAVAYQTPTYSVPPAQVFQSDDINNTTIFVGGLDPTILEEDLRQIFGQFGELVYVKIPLNKGCGFVQFGNRYGMTCTL